MLKGEVARHHRRRGRLPLVHALVDGGSSKAAVFFVDKDRPAFDWSGRPYMHRFVFEPDLRPGGRAGRWRQAAGEVGGGYSDEGLVRRGG